MNQLITVTSDHDSSLVIPSQFELFAPEFAITLNAAIGGEGRRLIDEELQSRRISFYGGEDAISRMEPQLQGALSVTAVCRLTRGEVVPKLYSNLVLRSGPEDLLRDAVDSLTPSTKQLLQWLILSEEHSRDMYWSERCCKTFAGMAGLQSIVIETDCLASPPEENIGHRLYMLQWLRNVRKAVPQLTHSHYLQKAGQDSFVRLSASGASGPFEVTFDIDVEFQNGLNATSTQ